MSSGKDYHMLPVPRPHMTFVGTLTLLAALQGCEKKTVFFRNGQNDIFQGWNHQEEDFKAHIGAIDSIN